MTNRICGTCAWFETDAYGEACKKDDLSYQGTCHQERTCLTVDADWWCRHWSETTGWDWQKPVPTQLEQAAADIFQYMSDMGPVPGSVTLWLEEYKRQC